MFVLRFLKYFNSQPHEEADVLKLVFRQPDQTFQLTASRRGWLSVFSTSKTILVFQLTASRRGWRHSIKSIVFCLIISTHSLTKRLTTLLVSVAFRYVKFQLTASRRGWRFPELILNYLIAFQLTASRRGWQGADGKSSYTWIFQLTASRRGWPKFSRKMSV